MKYAAVNNHYGDDYVAEINDGYDIDVIQETCEMCGDSDWVIGVYDTREEAEQDINAYYKDMEY